MSKVMKDNNTLGIIAGIVLLIGLVFLDLYFKNSGLSTVPAHRADTLAAAFTGSTYDWIGLVLFNVGILSLSIGLMGVYSVIMPPNSTWYNHVWWVALCGGLLLIFAV
jgi:hypothetical protein